MRRKEDLKSSRIHTCVLIGYVMQGSAIYFGTCAGRHWRAILKRNTDLDHVKCEQMICASSTPGTDGIILDIKSHIYICISRKYYTLMNNVTQCFVSLGRLPGNIISPFFEWGFLGNTRRNFVTQKDKTSGKHTWIDPRISRRRCTRDNPAKVQWHRNY